MSEVLDFGNGTWEEAGSAIRTVIETMHRDMYGNGKPGIKDDVAELKAIAKSSLAWLKGLATLVTIFIGILGIYVAGHH